MLLGVGSLADLIGHRRAYLGEQALFAVSSLACGLASDAGVLDVAPAVQGMGAGAMPASTTALLNSTYQGHRPRLGVRPLRRCRRRRYRHRAGAGRLVAQGLSWRWILFVNLPLSLVAIAMTARRVDIAGTLTFTAFAASLTCALIRAGEHGWATMAARIWRRSPQ